MNSKSSFATQTRSESRTPRSESPSARAYTAAQRFHICRMHLDIPCLETCPAHRRQVNRKKSARIHPSCNQCPSNITRQVKTNDATSLLHLVNVNGQAVVEPLLPCNGKSPARSRSNHMGRKAPSSICTLA